MTPVGNKSGLATPYFAGDGLSIIHGDCRAVLPALEAGSVGLVVTDPPYLVNYTGRWDGTREAIAGDGEPDWVLPVFAELWRLLKDDSFAVTFYGWPHAEVFVSAFKAVGFRLVSHLVFVKNVWGLGRFTRGQHEVAFLLAKGRPEIPGKPISDVIEWTREQSAFHPNQKPVSALVPLVLTYAGEGELVLDPFMGSGSTLLAARACGNPAIGIDIEERYCELATKRMDQKELFHGWAREAAVQQQHDSPDLFSSE
jgi:site-specific DNA-methyltransferase (adenine-specific)